jgi:tetratricopeptide (TPR) repeat protein
MDVAPPVKPRKVRQTVQIIVAFGLVVTAATVLTCMLILDYMQAQFCIRANFTEAVIPCEHVAEHGWLRRDLKLKVWSQLTEAYWYENKRPQGLTFYGRLLKDLPSDNHLLAERGKLLMWGGDVASARIDLEAVLAKDPTNQEASITLSGGLIEANEVEAAIKVLNGSAAATFPSSEVYRRLSSAHRSAGRLHIAAYYADLAVEKDENNAAAYNELALIFDRQGQRDSALAQIEKAISLNDTNTSFLDNKALILIDEERYAEAENVYRRLIELDNASSYFRSQLAFVLTTQNNYAASTAVLDRAKLDFPDTPDVLVETARLHYFQEDYVKARVAVNAALKLDAAHFKSRYWLASVDDMEGHDALALQSYRKLSSETPDTAYLLRDIASVLMDLQRYAESKASSTRAIELDGKNWRDWELRALANLRLEKWKEAEDDANQGIAHNSKHGLLFARRAYARWWLDKKVEAEADYMTALKLDSSKPWIRVELVDFLLTARRLDEAELQLQTVFKDPKPSAEAFKQRGRLAEIRNDAETALKDYVVAVSKDPDNGWFREDLAWALMMTGDTKGALAQCFEMQRILPEVPEAHRCLANVHWRIEDTAEARKELEAALALDATFLPAVSDLARLDFENNLLEDALERFTVLVKKQYNLARSLYWRGRVVAAMGNHEPALTDFEKALKVADADLARDISFDIQRLKNRIPLAKASRNDFYPQQR